METETTYTDEQLDEAGHDTEDYGRVRALCQHLSVEPGAVSVAYDHTFEINRRAVKRGTSPAKAKELAAFVRSTLAACDFVSMGRGFSPGHHWTRENINAMAYGYKRLMQVVADQQPEALNRGIHDFANSLWFLSSETDRETHAADQRDTLREAFDGVPIKDRRTKETTDDGQYLVLTDDEADEAWDDALEGCLDDSGIVPGADSPYFDREAWKRDAKMDGRGHSLNHYDGCEESEDVDGETYYIYRVN